MIQFPKDFLWGAATSAYQVEGGNSNSDWWHWEKEAGKERSGDACRHYEFYEKDFDLIKSLHHNAHRFSVEWARVEPEEGKFSEKELNHYLQVVLALRARGIEPIVTLHHFTNPLWFYKAGNWESNQAPEKFLRYARTVVQVLGKHVRYWNTINEPNIYYTHSYLLGWWPPQKKSLRAMLRVERNLIAGHVAVYRMIHQSYREQNLAVPMVGIAQHMSAFIPGIKNLKNWIAVFIRHKLFNRRFLDSAARKKTLDFIGLNYYSRQIVQLKRWGWRNLFEDMGQATDNPKKNSLGWDIYPDGLFQVLVKLKKYRVPVMITENGICSGDDDNLRWEFLKSHLQSVHLAMESGVPVIGYLYWSLMDNFEWAFGFEPRFGLIHIDYQTHQRTVRDSAKKYAEICRTSQLAEGGGV